MKTTSETTETASSSDRMSVENGFWNNVRLLRARPKASLNKSQRYQLKLRRAGKCPKCGKPCAPYYECDYHRQINRLKMAKKRAGIRLDAGIPKTDKSFSVLSVHDLVASVAPSPLDILMAKEDAAEKQELALRRSEFRVWTEANSRLLNLADVFIHLPA